MSARRQGTVFAGARVAWRSKRNSKRGATVGEANHQTSGQRLCVEQHVGVEVFVRGSLLAGERAETQRHGRIRSEKVEGHTEWTNP
jgi:hypothetical protein